MRPVHFQPPLPARGCCGQREGKDGPSQRRLLCPALQGRSCCCFRDRLRCLEPELIPASAGLWWRAANVTCLAPARAGRKTGGEFVLQGRARELLQCPFSPSLHSPCGENPSRVAGKSHGGVLPQQGPHIPPPCGKAAAYINGQMAQNTGIFSMSAAFIAGGTGMLGAVVREGVTHGEGFPLALHWFVRTTSLGCAAQGDF